jgi:hypothetical protein
MKLTAVEAHEAGLSRGLERARITISTAQRARVVGGGSSRRSTSPINARTRAIVCSAWAKCAWNRHVEANRTVGVDNIDVARLLGGSEQRETITKD